MMSSQSLAIHTLLSLSLSLSTATVSIGESDSHLPIYPPTVLSLEQIHNTQVHTYPVEPPNNGHVGDECFVHCSEVVPSSEVEMYIGRG